MWRAWLFLLVATTAARPAHESIDYNTHPYPNLDGCFRMPIHPAAQDPIDRELLFERFHAHRYYTRASDLWRFSHSRQTFRDSMVNPLGVSADTIRDLYKQMLSCLPEQANHTLFISETPLATREEEYAAVFSLVHGHCRNSPYMQTLEYLRHIHLPGKQIMSALPRNDPSTIYRCTWAIDDDGGCGHLTGTDDDEDDTSSPCADDDDGGGMDDRAIGQPPGITQHRRYPSKCCGHHSRQDARCGTSTRAFDDDANDADDEETTGHFVDVGNERDDDDGDDDDAKNTMSWVDNTSGMENVGQMYQIQRSLRAAHESLLDSVNFVNQIWLCAHNISVPMPFVATVDVPIQVGVPFTNTTNNITSYTLANTTTEVQVNGSMSVYPCAGGDELAQTQIFIFNVSVVTQQLMNVSVYDNTSMSFVDVDVAVNVTVYLEVQLEVTATIPDLDRLPQLDLKANLPLPVLPDLNINGSFFAFTNRTFSAFNYQSPGFFFNQTYTHNIKNITITGVLPILDPVSMGPYYMGRDGNGETCTPCRRLCDPIPFERRIQVMRARNATRFMASPLLMNEREERILYSHMTDYGDMLCEMMDMIDYIQCFQKTIQFPQIGRVFSCLELFYFGAPNAEHAMKFEETDWPIRAMQDDLREVQVWYAERGYYTQNTLDLQCIDPEMVEWAETCIDEKRAQPVLAGLDLPFFIDDNEETVFHYENTTRRKGACLYDLRHAPRLAGGYQLGRYLQAIPFPNTVCGPRDRTDHHEVDIAMCRKARLNILIQRLYKVSWHMRTSAMHLSKRASLLAELIRLAREEHPDDYVFPAQADKCFAYEGTVLEHFTPSGNITQAIELLTLAASLTPVQLIP